MITYNVVFNKGTDKGVYAISVVENPAMASELICLKEQTEIKLAEVDDVKFFVSGCCVNSRQGRLQKSRWQRI